MDSGLFEDVRDKFGFKNATRPALIGMAALLALAAVAIGYVLSNTAAASNFELVSTGVDAAAKESAAEEAAMAEEPLYVHVSGEVNKPGLYELSYGSRVADAVSAAGGFTEEASEESCNLARLVEDGEHIIVLSRTADQLANPDNADLAGVATAAVENLVNLNTATVSQLDGLPGIGESTARKIVADRASNGPFASVEDLMRVSGIGEKKLETLEGLVCV